MDNWSFEQTGKVLEELYHITDYSIKSEIYRITKGYALLVHYEATHFKKFNAIPNDKEFKTIEDYFELHSQKVKTIPPQNTNSEERYLKGYLSLEDLDFIKKNKLEATEIAGITDGNYAMLSEIELYEHYSDENIKKKINRILYNATLGKIKSINSFANLNYFLGSVPKLVDRIGSDNTMKQLFESFKTFLELSLLVENYREK